MHGMAGTFRTGIYVPFNSAIFKMGFNRARYT